jgi:hypothetical protein
MLIMLMLATRALHTHAADIMRIASAAILAGVLLYMFAENPLRMFYVAFCFVL